MTPNDIKCDDLTKRITSLQGTYNAQFIISNPKQAKEVKTRIDAMKEEYKNLKCDELINASRGEYVSSAINIFNTLDTKRIQSQSIYERNKRVIFGGVILILGIALIMNFRKSKK